jgi:ribosomal protein S18 acetylase RimI-like enzyme
VGGLYSIDAAAPPTRFTPAGDNTYPPSKVLERLPRPETLFFIAELNDHPAGYIYLNIHDVPENEVRQRISMLYIEHIYVDDKYRSQGIGTALINAARATARERGIPQLGLRCLVVQR